MIHTALLDSAVWLGLCRVEDYIERHRPKKTGKGRIGNENDHFTEKPDQRLTEG